MPGGIVGAGNTYNLPNYVGELFLVSPQETPLLSAIGGLTGGKEANGSYYIDWSMYDLRDPDDKRQRKEGANAPTAEARVRGTEHSILEIHHEALEITYTKQAAVGQVGDIGVNNPLVANVLGTNAVLDEMDFQLKNALIQIARDVEASFTTGTYHDPGDNSEARRTRGILEAIETNVRNAGGDDFALEMLLNLMQDIWTVGGISVDETRTLLCGGTQKRRITKAAITDANYRQESRTVGGVHVDVIETDFGKVNIMLDRYMPDDTITVLSLEELAPRFLNIPGKGHFFEEPLAKTGSSDKTQIYGEIGLEYGSEIDHGKIEGLSTDEIGS